MITECGRRLSALVDETIYCARLEGGGFAVILTANQDHQLIQSRRFAQTIIDLLALPHTWDGSDLRTTISVGMAMSSLNNDDAVAVFKNAMIAVQEAKSRGESQYCLFDNAMREGMLKRVSLLSAMEQVVDTDAFFPMYQPKVCMKSQRVTGAECLMRWRNDDGEIISPLDFIPLAEESGLIVPIGEHFLQRVVNDVAQWQVKQRADFVLAVNISAVQLTDANLPNVIEKILRKANFPANRLELELTESAVMENANRAIETMTALSTKGIRIAIDDFGTGYSSLSYLKRLPVDTLKIDQSFVRDVCEDTNDAAIVNAVIGLAHYFNLEVVAEGIENAEQLKFLQKKLCDVGQGYLIGKPMLAENFMCWYKEWHKKSA